MDIKDPILDRMKVYLDFSARKQNVITSNLANAETPGYRSKELQFEELFRNELDVQKSLPLRTTRAGHLRGKPVLVRGAEIQEAATDAQGKDQNNVDLDKEMTELAQNVLKFSVVSQLMQKKLSVIGQSIREGR